MYTSGANWNRRVPVSAAEQPQRSLEDICSSALADGRKQLLAVHDGFRESELSWIEVLEDLKRRGLEIAPKLAVGDGGLGFWAALRKVYPTTREQRCWVHKTANVLDKLPQSMQGKAKSALHNIYLAESRTAAEGSLDHFAGLYEAKYPKAVACLKKDRAVLLTFYDFPAEHWGHQFRAFKESTTYGQGWRTSNNAPPPDNI